MLRRLFAPRRRRVPSARPPVRLGLETLETREVLDAALVQGFNFLTLTAYQTAQQVQQAQAVTQSDLAQFHSDAAQYTAGQGVTITQINQDLTKLQQDATNLQGLVNTLQTDGKYFIMGLLANLGSFSPNDDGSLFVDAYVMLQTQSLIPSALQTAGDASAATAPAPPSSSGSGSSSTSNSQLVTLTLNPLNVNLLGLNVQTSQIQINIAAQSGNGELLGNLLGDTSNLLNLPAVSNVVNEVLGNVVTLLNSASLSVAGVNTSSGSLSSPVAGAGSTSVLTLHVAPITLNLMGAEVTTSPIDLTLTAQPGQGQVLGNVVADLANLFNPPLPSTLSIDTINSKLSDLLNELNQQIPNIGSSSVPSPTNLSPSGQFLSLTVAPINLNLLGMILQTSSIQVNATNQVGNGDLLGNITTTALNTLGATPANLTTLNTDLNAILGKVIGVLNASTLTLPAGAVSSLSPVLQELTSPTLVNPSGNASAPILNLAIASPTNQTPVDVNLLGLDITTSNIQAQILAQTGDGQVLGNLLYNVANLLNPGGTASLLPILTELGL